MPKLPNRSRRLQALTDKLAEAGITIAGVTVIAAMFAMLVLIVREAAPLFLPASQKLVGEAALPGGVAAADVVALGVDADLRGGSALAGMLLRDGRCVFLSSRKGQGGGASPARLSGAPESAGILSAEAHGGGLFSLLWDDGTVALYAMKTEFSPEGGSGGFERIFESGLDISAPPPRFVFLRGEEGNHRTVAIHADGTVEEKTETPAKGLRARGSVASARTIRPRHEGSIVAAALNDGGNLYLGTDAGDLVAIDLSRDGDAEAPVGITPAFRDRRPITSLAFLNGGYALAVGDAGGGVSVWFPRRENGVFRLRRSLGWAEDGGPVGMMAVSGRDRGFIALGEAGGLRWLHSTTGRELASLAASRSRPVALAMNGRGDTLATLHADGMVDFRRLDSSHPEAGWAGFFRRLLYEGYETPAHIWQSTGSDASEPKLSLVPLIWGSVKAAVFALLFATPIALSAAMYVSQFAGERWRSRIKPAVEMLAAVPSVVVGFIAALWLAPLLERYMGVFVDGFRYDQRNSLVIAVAMGFAIIPTIFSLAEDAINAVPPSLSAASLALGASKWQTVLRVVLPTASPGIFTAVMLGFGRAVGETMIVLMAAGNTPIIDLSPFTGMRTLSANIAVEMPEAPVGGTLYRTLFLCALILFLLTLAINTAAERCRRRLRTRYGKI